MSIPLLLMELLATSIESFKLLLIHGQMNLFVVNEWHSVAPNFV